MNIPYRTRRALRALGIAGLIVVLALIIIWMIWLFWLDRYVVYSRDGAKLDFSVSNQQLSGEAAIAPEDDMTVSIFYNEGDNALNMGAELTQLSGYYITKDMLSDIPGIMSQLKKLPEQTPVLLEVKDIVGRFFYTTSLGPNAKDVDPTAVDELISYLANSGLYMIARAPALRDYYYGLNNVPDGLPTAGGYLWMENDTNCYWLNPASEGTLTYLMQIASELKGLGFDEVVFSDWRFPQTDKIVFKGDKNQALVNAASSLLTASAGDRFAVSFIVEDPALPLPAGRSRMYLEGIAAADAKATASQTTVADTAINLVFLTDVNDTRFDVYSVLRPLTAAQIEE